MNAVEKDFIVVGGGPAGALSAQHLAGVGSVILFSDVTSKTPQCAGIVSKRGLERIGAADGDFVLNKVSGAKLVSPGGRIVDIDGGKVKAHVLDRFAFDEHLRERAVDAGVELIGERANVSIDRRVKAGGRQYNADRIVLASGTNYTIHRRLGLEAPKRFLVGIQYDMRVDCDEDKVELHFNTPDFFSWVVPAGDRVRVGTATEGNPVPYLESLLRKLGGEGRLKSKSILSKTAGLIPIYMPSIKTQYDGLVTVGDAAGHVKATTGGGIVYGGLAAKLTDRGDYGRAWRKTAGGELRLHLLIRRILSRMNGRGLDRLFSVVDENKSVLEEGGDMDSAKQTVFSMAKNPGFILSVLRNSPALMLDLI